ncbi:MAG: hypothetical protein MK213_05910 [Planctomycetes bacterium]|nr:hypothetical protein [Planctomycetota bacterium]
MIIAISVILFALVFIFLLVVDNAFESIVKWVFRKIGIGSGVGPQMASAHLGRKDVMVSLENLGKDSFHLVAIEGVDEGGERFFPIPYRIGEMMIDVESEKNARKQLSGVKVPPASVMQAFFHIDELNLLKIKSLGVLDSDGKSWPINLSQST